MADGLRRVLRNPTMVWLVDPGATTLEICRLDGEGWRLVQTHAGDATIRAEPFDAVELDRASLWSR